MKKLFTLCAAVIASFSLWAATESHPTSVPASNADIVGTSYTIPGTHNAGAGSAKVGAMPDKGIKFRLNRAAGDLSNAIEFTVNEGYVINAIQLVGITNSKGVTATVGSIYVDGVAWNGTFNGALPAKDASEASDIQVSGIAAAQSVVFVFSDLGGASQGNICYTVTYEEAVQKEVDHVVKTLTGAAVNGEALSDPQMATLLSGTLSLDLANAYVEAPTVTFTVQTDTYYVGEETPSTKSEDINVVAELAAGMWQAQYTIGEQTYTIRATKPATHTITFMDGETVLGTEVVAHGETSTKHTNFETKPLAEFQGWYTDAELTSEANLSATVSADMVLYGKFVKAYAQSLNIEQYILDNGRNNADQDHIGEAFAAVLSGAGYAYSNLNALDSLNNAKGAARNEPYLGLKIKTQGGFIACNVAAGNTIRVKFGYVENNVLAIAGNDTLTLTPANKTLDVLEYTATADTYVKIQTTSGKTVVIKQIMVDEAIADVMYKITYAASENGEVSGWTVAYPGESVTLNFAPAAGYMVMHCYVNETEIHQSAPGEPITFEMPAEDVTITTEFSLPTAIDNTDAAVKATKRVIDGVLFIEKNGVLYNAQGAIVK